MNKYLNTKQNLKYQNTIKYGTTINTKLIQNIKSQKTINYETKLITKHN